jgi:hypothetical protein
MVRTFVDVFLLAVDSLLDAPDFDALGGLGLGASDLDTRGVDTRSTGKWCG